MTHDEVNSLQPGDVIAIPDVVEWRGVVDMITENYIAVKWPSAHKLRNDILQISSPLWRAMVRR